MHVNTLPGNFVALLLPIAILELILIVFALFDLIRRKPEQVRGNKILWAVIILLISTIGPICYLTIGRKQG